MPWAPLWNLVAEIFLIFAAQQVMKQMRADVDSQRDHKLAKYQLALKRWPEHRRFFPQSRLRKVHLCLMLSMLAAMVGFFFATWSRALAG